MRLVLESVAEIVFAISLVAMIASILWLIWSEGDPLAWKCLGTAITCGFVVAPIVLFLSEDAR